jgi:hypothetical protein
LVCTVNRLETGEKTAAAEQLVVKHTDLILEGKKKEES